MRKGEGCEIEARGLTYKIPISKHASKATSNPCTINHENQDDDDDDDDANHHHEPSPSRYVLKNVSCRAKPWELLAVVGPSGAGKSTLLALLAGRLPPPSPSSILVNHHPINLSHHKKLTGYVTQRDTLFPLLTVHETLLFTARLRLGLRHPASALSARVDALLRELGLSHVAHTRVGDAAGRVARGISGGERRRVSIGVEIVHDPSVLVLDEPTSGLDSASALQVTGMLKSMAESRGRTVVLSIHQPGSRIVKLFNSLLLLAGGQALYHGTPDGLNSHLAAAGRPLPPHCNIVEFAIDAIETLQQNHQEIHQETPQRVATERCTLQQLFQLHKVADEESLLTTAATAAGSCSGGGGDTRYANSWICETAILAHRFVKNVLRTKELFACRTIQMLASGLVLGSIFYNLDDDRNGAAERVGLFAFILTFLLSCTTEALPIFLQEREILMKETSSGSYRVSSYVVANGLVFLPFLLIVAVLFSVPVYWLVGLNASFGSFSYFLVLIWLILYMANSVVVCFAALVPNFIVGNSVISGVMGSFFLFSGYFISKEGMPKYWVFMHYVSLFKYPFEGFLVNEFSSGSGRCLEYREGVCVLDGDGLLREEGFGDGGRWRNVGVMVGFVLGYRFVSYVILRCRCWCTQRGGLRTSLVSR